MARGNQDAPASTSQSPAAPTQPTPAADAKPVPVVKSPKAAPEAKSQVASSAKPQADATAKTTPTTKASPTGVAKSAPKTGPKAAAPLTLKTNKAKQSYALGINVGARFHDQGLELTDVDTLILLRGLKDALGGGKEKRLLTDEEMRGLLTQLQNDLRKKQMDAMQAVSAGNKKAGQTFLGANKEKDGVVTLPSGLQYRILTEGTGAKPAATDTVVCNYRGTLLDGKEFDSSYKRGQPATFLVTGVIKGWTEALQLMPVGSKWQLFVPSELAYGEQGRRPAIEPGATLIFDVELVSIQEKPKQ